jgi:hypothetical protein
MMACAMMYFWYSSSGMLVDPEEGEDEAGSVDEGLEAEVLVVVLVRSRLAVPEVRCC